MKHPRNGPAILAAAAGLAVLLVGCSDRSPAAPEPDVTTSATEQTATSTTASNTATGAVQPTETPSRPGSDLTVSEVVAQAEPAVVRIESGGGVGTGFIVSEDGYIVTNNHVVEGRGPGGVVNVTLSDGETLAGRVVGTDPRADLALVQIEGGPYRTLPLGNLDDVVIGQDVVAIGYALDLEKGEGPSYSVTRGIVSQKNRAISESAPILGAIQTDAAINHGNSGGPLLDMSGAVIGVNTALAPDPESPTGIAQGIGFAVGVDTVKAVWEQLRDNGSVNRGYLGIGGFEALRPAQARDLGIPEDEGGVYLSAADSVGPGTPANLAGIQSGDVITKIGDSELDNEGDLAVAMIEHGPGEVVDVEIFRGSERMTVSVTLGVAPA